MIPLPGGDFLTLANFDQTWHDNSPLCKKCKRACVNPSTSSRKEHIKDN